MQFPPPDTRISYDLLAVATSAKASLFYLITGRIISLSDRDFCRTKHLLPLLSVI
jgi:hypothetical protein